MTHKTKRIGLAVGAAVMALGLAAGVYASTQNTNGEQGPFIGRRGGPGEPRSPGLRGSVLGPIQVLASQLGLTDAQKDQIKAFAQQAKAAEAESLRSRPRVFGAWGWGPPRDRK